MKIILFNSENQVLDIFLSEDIVVDGDSISFDGNKLTGIKANYIIVDDSSTDVKIGEKIPELLKEKDKKNLYVKQPEGEQQEQDINQLKEESANQMQAIADIYEMLLGTGGTN